MRAVLPPSLEMLKKLVASPSVSCPDPALDCSDRGVLDLLAGWLEPLGFAIRIDYLGKPGKYNLIARWGRGEGGLVLAGHADTVPCDPDLWRHDPFCLHRFGSRVSGLGVTDMKGFFPAALAAVAEFVGRKPKKPLVILATADEETTMLGARALTPDTIGGMRAIIGEPTSLRPVHMHKGFAAFELQVHGRSGHSSDPRLGVNAIECARPLIAAILSYRDECLAHVREQSFIVPMPTLNLGHIHGGDNANRICGALVMRMDLRLLPGMDYGQHLSELDRILAAVPLPEGASFELRLESQPIPAFALAAHSLWLQLVQDLLGTAAETAAFATEAPFLSALGTDVIVLGPGDIDCAHQPNEYLDLKAVEQMQALLTKLIASQCFA